jgi:hypothetical protein
VLSLKKNILLPIYNSDDVVMSRENRNFHLRLFVKGRALQVATPMGKSVICRKIVLGYPIYNKGRTLTANLIVFDIEGFDIILGMDWLSNNHDINDWRNKEIILRLPADTEFKFFGTR